MYSKCWAWFESALDSQHGHTNTALLANSWMAPCAFDIKLWVNQETDNIPVFCTLLKITCLLIGRKIFFCKYNVFFFQKCFRKWLITLFRKYICLHTGTPSHYAVEVVDGNLVFTAASDDCLYMDPHVTCSCWKAWRLQVCNHALHSSSCSLTFHRLVGLVVKASA